MKFLVDRTTGAFQGPTTSQVISGTYPVYVPYDDFVYRTFSTDVNFLISEKDARIELEAKKYLAPYSSIFDISSEFIDGLVPIELTTSTKYTVGINRRYVLKPGGKLTFGPYNFAAATSKFYCQYNAYYFINTTPSNGWNPPIQSFNDADLVADIRFNLLDNVLATVETFSIGYNSTLLPYSGNFYVQLENLSASKDLHLADFYLYFAW